MVPHAVFHATVFPLSGMIHYSLRHHLNLDHQSPLPQLLLQYINRTLCILSAVNPTHAPHVSQYLIKPLVWYNTFCWLQDKISNPKWGLGWFPWSEIFLLPLSHLITDSVLLSSSNLMRLHSIFLKLPFFLWDFILVGFFIWSTSFLPHPHCALAKMAH